MKGRKSKPTAIKRLTGNPGKRPLNGREPQPEVGVGAPPPWLSPLEAELWDQLAEQLGPLGMLTETDRSALAVLVATFDEWRSAHQVLQARGMTFMAHNSQGQPVVKPRPEVAIRADAARRLTTLLAEFGLTPSSRSRVSAVQPKEEYSVMWELLSNPPQRA